MNIYEKLQNVKILLASSKLKKSGKNNYSGFTYFELSDFLPRLNELMLEHKLTTVINFINDTATLEFINIEDVSERILFTSPVAEANLKGCHPIQNLGAIQTYMRRYLYINALDLVESDYLDSTVHKPEVGNIDNTNHSLLSSKQVHRLYVMSLTAKITKEQLLEYIKKQYKKNEVNLLTKKEYDEICERLTSKAKEVEEG